MKNRRLRRQEDREWDRVLGLINDEVNNLLRILSVYLERIFDVTAADALEYHRRFPERLNQDLDDPHYTLYILSNVVLPELREKLNKFDLRKWEEIGILTKTALEYVDHLFVLFGNKLNPEIYEILLDVQRTARRLIVFADVIFKFRSRPVIDNAIEPVRDFVNACVQLGQLLIPAGEK